MLRKWDGKKETYHYQSADNWYKYLFVDGGDATCQSHGMLKKLNTNNTYDRWINWGTLYGMSKYSLVMLTGDFDKTPSYLIRHLQTIYYKMAELCLVQRATILNYADEVTHVSGILREKKHNHTEIREKVTELYKMYIVFINKIHFSEVTAQEQGIEMYDMMQKELRIPAQVKTLDEQISELHNYVSMEDEAINNKLVNRLTTLGAVFLPLSLLVGIFGMNTMPGQGPDSFFSEIAYPPFWMSLSITFAITGIMMTVIFSILSNRKWGGHFKKWLIPALLFIIALASFIIYFLNVK